jgi:hypothetical protein
VQIESLPATVLSGIEEAGGEAPTPKHSHRSDGLEHPAADAVSVGFLAVLAIVLVMLTVSASRVRDIRGLVLAALTAAAAVATFGKVLSPQFMIWLVPIAAVAWAWGMYALGVVTTAAISVTLAWFPDRYFDLVDRDDDLLAIVAGRNLLLLLMLALAAWELRRLVRGSRAAAESMPQAHPAVPRSALH